MRSIFAKKGTLAMREDDAMAAATVSSFLKQARYVNKVLSRNDLTHNEVF